MNLITRISMLGLTVGTCAAMAAAFTDSSCSASAKAKTAQHVALGAMSSEVVASDIVDTAIAAGSFKTLVAAVQAAGLVDALKSDGPFTVFAPTDAAFAKLPAGTVETLLKPENRKQLTSILLYHVVPGKVESGDVLRRGGATTLNGQRIAFSKRGSAVMIGSASLATADISCSNGVIHVIDTVILPASDDIVQTADKVGSFSTLLAAAKAAGLVDALKGEGPITVFAPTDEAFSKLPAGTVESLLKPENKDMLAAVLKYHVVAGRIFAADAVKAGSAVTLNGQRLTIDIRNGRVFVDGAAVVASDVDASNGVIHVIDTVMLPR